MVDAKDLDYGAYACEAMTWSPRGVHGAAAGDDRGGLSLVTRRRPATDFRRGRETVTTEDLERQIGRVLDALREHADEGINAARVRAVGLSRYESLHRHATINDFIPLLDH